MSEILKVSNEENPRVFSTETTTTAKLTTYYTKVSMVSSIQPQNSTVLAWLQTHLTLYIELNLITPFTDLSNLDYWLGKPISCLAHHFFPEAFEKDIIQQLNTTDNSKALELFKTRLNVTFKDDVQSYFEHIQTAIEQQMTIDATLRDLYIGLTEQNEDEPLAEKTSIKQQMDEILIPMTKLYHQCMELVKHDALTHSSSTTRSPSPRIIMDDIHSAVEDLQLPIESRLLRQQPQSQELTLEDIEICFSKLDNKLMSFEHLFGQLPPDLKHHPDLATHLSRILLMHAVFKSQLEKGLRTSVGIEFSSTTAYIRNELEFIQAKMLKTTTTDTGIQDLEMRSTQVGVLIEKLNERYQDRDEHQEQQYATLMEKYQLVVAWVDEVRVWFVEAERIRVWIEERIEKLESKPTTNPLDEVEFDYTQDQITEWNGEQESLEKEVEVFDAQDMTRLRAHVKALTSTHNKDLSPADTTTIEITFTTLMTLDRLMHLLRRHGYELQMLTLRMAWEQSYLITVSWVRSTAEDVKHFVQVKARWKPSNADTADTDKNEIIATLIQFEQQIASFDQGQFTLTVNCYQDLDDNCPVELPTHLESRQVAIEEAFEELTRRIGFARQVVEQYLVVTDFLSKADELKTKGELLRQEMAAAELKPSVQLADFQDRVGQFQEEAVRLVTGLAARIPYPDTLHPTDQEGNEESNQAIRMVVGARKSALILFGEALDQGLNSLRRSIQSLKRAGQLEDEIGRLAGWIDERSRSMERSNVNALVAGKCALNEIDVARLKKELEGQVTKLNGIKTNDVMKLKENIQLLTQASSAYHPNNTHILSQIDQLGKSMVSLEMQMVALEKAFELNHVRLDILNQRISWETQYAKAALWISNTTFEVWDFITREAQWRMATTMDEDRNEKKWDLRLLDEWERLEGKVKGFYESQIKSVSDVFVDLKNNFDSPAVVQMNENHSLEEGSASINSEHLQHRQDMLNQNYNNLHDLIGFADQVINQHRALTDFTLKTRILQKQGQELLTNAQDAITNIMTLDQEKDHHYVVSTVKQFGEAVIDLWMASGSQLPYPQCPEDARATRPTTNDDEISTEIATAVYKMYTELQDLVKRLSEIIQILDVAMVYRLKIEQWCKETIYTTEIIKTFSHLIQTYEFDLNTSAITHEDQPVELEICAEKQKEFSEQLEDYRVTRYGPLKDQLVSLLNDSNSNGCNTVDIKITQDPSIGLEESWKDLSENVNLFQQRLLVCETRKTWHSTWKSQNDSLNALHNKLQEWCNEKAVWSSKYESENNIQGKQELDMLITQCKALHQELDHYIQHDRPHLIDTHENLVTVFRRMNIPDDFIVLGTAEQSELEKLFTKLSTSMPACLSEVNSIKERYEWERRVDDQLKLCQDKKENTEKFIESDARWSSSSGEIDAAKLKALHDSTAGYIVAIDTLIQEQPQPSTESVFRRKSNLETLKDRLKHHDAFLDEVVMQRKALSSLVTEFDAMEAQYEATKSLYLSMTSPPEEEQLEKYKKAAAAICDSADCKITYPVRHYRDHDASARERDMEHNQSVQEMIKIRQAQLIEAGNTLEAILRSKERLSRRKAAEESYLAEAKAIELWIETQVKQLNSLKESKSAETLKDIVSHVNALNSAVSTYTSSHHLDVMANKYITSIQQQQGDDDAEEVANCVRLIENKHQTLIRDWKKLSTDVAKAQEDLSFELRQTDFLNSVSLFKEECDDFHRRVVAKSIDDITEDISSQWQDEIQALENKSFENIRSKVEESWATDFEQVETQFSALKSLVQERVSEANFYRSKRSFFEGADNLTRLIEIINVSLNELTCMPLAIEGNLEKDRQLLDRVSLSFLTLCETIDRDQEVYDEQRSFYRFLQLNKVPDLEEVDERQRSLEKQWKKIKSDVSEIKQQQITPMTQWFELHARLNDIKEGSLNGVFDRLNQFERLENDKEGVMPAFLEQDGALLTLLRHRTTACLDISKNLPQHDENMSSFRKKYDALLEEIQVAEHLLSEKRLLAQQQIDLAACKGLVEAACEKMNEQVQHIANERVCQVQDSSNLEEIFKDATTNFAQRESIHQSLNSEVSALKQRINVIKEKYGSLEALPVLQDQLSNTQKGLANALREYDMGNSYIRRVLSHGKSADNIVVWLDNCNIAIENLGNLDDQLDESAVTAELASLTYKVNDFEKVVKQFQDLSKDVTNIPAAGHYDGFEVLSASVEKSVISPKTDEISQKWKVTQDKLEATKRVINKAVAEKTIARKIKHLTSLITETNNHVSNIPLIDYDEEPVYEAESEIEVDSIVGNEADVEADTEAEVDADDDDDKTQVDREEHDIKINIENEADDESAEANTEIVVEDELNKDNIEGDETDENLENDIKIRVEEESDNKDIIITVKDELDENNVEIKVEDEAVEKMNEIVTESQEPAQNTVKEIEIKTVIKPKQLNINSFPRQTQLKDIESNLKHSESEAIPQIDQELKALSLFVEENRQYLDENYAQSYVQLEESVNKLKDQFKTKHTTLDKSMAIGSYLRTTDDIEILQTSLEEAINQSAPAHSAIIGALSRTDLHAKLIELDARFKYYEDKIKKDLTAAREKADKVKQVSEKGGVIVEEHLHEMEKKWAWIKKQFKTRKIELSRSIDTSLDSKEQQARIRKSSLPTRKVSSLFRDRADMSLNKQRLSPTVSSASSSSSSHNNSTSRFPSARLMAPLPHQASKSATNLKTKPRPSTSAAVKQPLNSYVADPMNDLDMEIGRIVNETPYFVKVKMVPGEVGRYWFGNLNPKLCYCRVLKSKMVMVRVGGGWTELSQFLRDHALLEGDFIPRSKAGNPTLHKKNSATTVIPEEDEELKSPTIQEGFIEALRPQQLEVPGSHRRPSIGGIRPVTGSPSHSANTQAGYKEGNKFITVDSFGNQHEVHMRKAPSNFVSRSTSSSANPTVQATNNVHLNDYTKQRIARRKEKKAGTSPSDTP